MIVVIPGLDWLLPGNRLIVTDWLAVAGVGGQQGGRLDNDGEVESVNR